MAKGFYISSNGDFITGENGNTAIFNVMLTAAPTTGRTVTLKFSSSNTAEGTVTNPVLTFDASNWNIANKVVVNGINDYNLDGDIAYFLNAAVDSSSTDVDYRQMSINPIGLINSEDVTTSDLPVDAPRIPSDTPLDTPLKFYGDAIVDTTVIDPKTGFFKVTGTLPSNDVLQGLDGNDTLYGGNLQDDLSGGLGNDTLYGENDEDFLYGEAGNDTLFGGTGVDYLEGGTGDDVLNGGVDDLMVDTMVGGAGSDTYYVGYGAVDVIIDRGLASDVDTVIMPFNLSSYTLPAAIESGTIAPGTQASSLKGNTGNNTLTGNDGSNTLDGGAGKDVLNGGNGNDTYVVNVSADAVVETATSGGTDTVKASASFALSVNIENLVLTGNSAINGTGNSANNTITGNVGSNSLVGDLGNDVLNGGAGNDVLTGGTGLDVFRFNSGLTAGIDKITDFSVADDTIQLENAIFTKLAATGVLNPNYFVAASAAVDLNDYIVYDSTSGNLMYDADGSGAGAGVQIGMLGVGLGLTNADFMVI